MLATINVWQIAEIIVIGEWIGFSHQDINYKPKFEFGKSQTICQIHQTLPLPNFSTIYSSKIDSYITIYSSKIDSYISSKIDIAI